MTETIASNSTVPDGAVRTEALRVDFLYFDDCPSHPRALELLKEVLRAEGANVPIHVHQVETEEAAEQLRFPGSPTIRVAGMDIDDNPDLPVGLCCRAYRQPNGKISPLPPRDKIVAAVRGALNAVEHLPPTIGG